MEFRFELDTSWPTDPPTVTGYLKVDYYVTLRSQKLKSTQVNTANPFGTDIQFTDQKPEEP